MYILEDALLRRMWKHVLHQHQRGKPKRIAIVLQELWT